MEEGEIALHEALAPRNERVPGPERDEGEVLRRARGADGVVVLQLRNAAEPGAVPSHEPADAKPWEAVDLAK